MISGILLIALGTFVLFTPVGAFKVLAALFSFTIMLTGLIETYFAYINRENLENWGSFFAGGIFNTIIGSRDLFSFQYEIFMHIKWLYLKSKSLL